MAVVEEVSCLVFLWFPWGLDKVMIGFNRLRISPVLMIIDEISWDSVLVLIQIDSLIDVKLN